MDKKSLQNIVFDTIKIKDLHGVKFVVPDYQRGYRWGEDEIRALINDVLECERNYSNKEYCLQPLVVKFENGEFRLIDGQQRLTTLFILTQLAKASATHPSDKKLIVDFSIKYEIRDNSEEFLAEIESPSGKYDAKSNPDFYYMSEAKKHIENCIPGDKSIFRVYETFLKCAQFIWYRIDNRLDDIEMFQKLNVGKINLTNAELVKAALLTWDNHNPTKYAKMSEPDRNALITNTLKSKAREWDYIEQSLANNDFWYFVADEKYKKDSGPRIAIILDAIASDISGEEVKKNAFNIIYDDIKSFEGNERVKRVDEIWKMISSKHSLFCEWFDDDEIYHLIGFLVRAGISTVREISVMTNKMRKKKIVSWLKEEIRSWKYLWKNPKVKDQCKETKDIDYDDKKSDLRNFFLLFNILTILQTLYEDEKKKTKKTIVRFPFDKYVIQDWDIEHIHAKKDENEIEDEHTNSIYNLTLLDRQSNRDYKNAQFNEKRDYIREKAKTDRFIPPCTQNVFFKVYTTFSLKTDGSDKRSNNITKYWTKEDFDEYKSKQKEVESIKKADEYKKKVDSWNELDWFFYEREINAIVFESFLKEIKSKEVK